MLRIWRPLMSSASMRCGWPNTAGITVHNRGYAKKAPVATGVATLASQKKKLPVETDPERLATYCCGSNFHAEGEDVKLGPDDDYPDWLWTLHLGKPKLPCELDRNTEEYWETLHKNALYHQNKLRSSQPREKLRINEKEKFERLEAIVHRALAYRNYDPGEDFNRTTRDRLRKFGPCGLYHRNDYTSPHRATEIRNFAKVIP